jgi:hypothetical protein
MELQDAYQCAWNVEHLQSEQILSVSLVGMETIGSSTNTHARGWDMTTTTMQLQAPYNSVEEKFAFLSEVL